MSDQPGLAVSFPCRTCSAVCLDDSRIVLPTERSARRGLVGYDLELQKCPSPWAARWSPPPPPPANFAYVLTTEWSASSIMRCWQPDFVWMFHGIHSCLILY